MICLSAAWVVLALILVWCALLSLVVLSELRGVEELRAARSRARPASNELPPGTLLPELDMELPDGRAFRTTQLSGHSAVLLFLRTACPACHSMATWIGESIDAVRTREPGLQVVVFSEGRSPLRLDDSVAVLDEAPEVQEAFRLLHVSRTPWAYRIDREGRVAAGAVPTQARGLDDLFSLRHGGDPLGEHRKRPGAARGLV